MTSHFNLIAASRFAASRQQGEAQFIIDVRSPAEFRALHVAGARNVPLDRLEPRQLVEQLRGQGLHSGAQLYLLCQRGQRAQQAAEQLKALLPGMQVVEGGTEACVACGMAVDQNASGVISLQRQVQISAGSLVLLGTLLGTWLHPAWYGLAAFVGAGLTFAGLSNTCGMALLLARMPWNR
ncbi:hypothetical protein A9179_12345 [Pseudomonas alcaligenes]|uniref:Rhodanese domain-containing protein n=1 Tax=Aquipseudomonas alcaligenes TaxID=43263 RepID=A0ABR7S0F6_AQUAC|nr:rhodanese-like domain-containing protein [Pseudomonas alcaligenes]MBC9251066.1 hypothetical protein [Pseudomonas alcaligenes]